MYVLKNRAYVKFSLIVLFWMYIVIYIVMESFISTSISGKRTTEGIGSKLAASAPVAQVLYESGISKVSFELYDTYHNEKPQDIVNPKLYKKPVLVFNECQIQEPYRNRGKCLGNIKSRIMNDIKTAFKLGCNKIRVNIASVSDTSCFIQCSEATKTILGCGKNDMTNSFDGHFVYHWRRGDVDERRKERNYVNESSLYNKLMYLKHQHPLIIVYTQGLTRPAWNINGVKYDISTSVRSALCSVGNSESFQGEGGTFSALLSNMYKNEQQYPHTVAVFVVILTYMTMQDIYKAIMKNYYGLSPSYLWKILISLSWILFFNVKLFSSVIHTILIYLGSSFLYYKPREN